MRKKQNRYSKVVCKDCGQFKLHKAHGLCYTCYDRWLRKHNPNYKNYKRAWQLEKEKKEVLLKKSVKAKTRYKLGKPIRCVLCDSTDRVQFHHYTEPYEWDKAIPLCKFHHNKFH